MSRVLVIGVITGLIVGLLMVLVWRYVPGLTELVPAGWHSAVTGGICGAATVIVIRMTDSKS